MNRRIVVTGIGAITPIGSGVEGLWEGLRRGIRAGRPITRFDSDGLKSRVAAEIPGFEPNDYMDAKKARHLDRFSQLSVAISRQALEDAGLQSEGSGERLRRGGVYLGSALGGVPVSEVEHERYVLKGLRAVSPRLALSVFGGAGPTNVAMEFGRHGPSMGNTNSCASGATAIGEAFQFIKGRGADVALAGGVETPIARLTIDAFSMIRATSTRNEEPERASRPFDSGRDGFVMAEGGAMLVLEERGHALARGATPYAELVGYGATNDAYHMTAPRPGSEEAARAISEALGEAALSPEEVGYVNAHATSTPLGDVAEALAIRRSFGEHAGCLPVSGTKGLHGHALGASGAIEAAITTLVLERGWLPPTFNLEERDPQCEPLCHVPTSGMDKSVDVAVTNSFGFGGFNTVLAFRRADAL